MNSHDKDKTATQQSYHYDKTSIRRKAIFIFRRGHVVISQMLYRPIVVRSREVACYGCYYTLQWRHNGHDSVSDHQPHGCLLNHLFRRGSKKTWKLRVTGLCAGNSPGPVNSSHKWPVTRKMFPFDDVIMRRTYDDITNNFISCQKNFHRVSITAESQIVVTLPKTSLALWQKIQCDFIMAFLVVSWTLYPRDWLLWNDLECCHFLYTYATGQYNIFISKHRIIQWV